jgi:hypothetical protein
MQSLSGQFACFYPGGFHILYPNYFRSVRQSDDSPSLERLYSYVVYRREPLLPPLLEVIINPYSLWLLHQ